MALSRRGFLLGALAVAGCSYSSPTGRVRIAAGEPGGFYVEFARLLAGEMRAVEPEWQVEVVETLGSVMNLSRVAAGEAELGLTLADALAAARSGSEPFTAPIDLTALGRVYENYMQLVVRADSPIRTLPDLSGHHVSLGASGSGAALFGGRLIEAAEVRVIIDHHPLADAVAALRENRVQALLWSGGLPTPALSELDNAIGIRLLDLASYIAPLRSHYGPVYDHVTIPGNTYRDPTPITTIGVPNLLIPSPGLSSPTIATTVRVLVDRATTLVPQQALGTQYLDVRSLIDTAPAPLHPAAAQMYRDLRG
ncbi:TRAP transporter TAXI family solute receptor [Actinokineospora baliensis]|uniref:TAXI family TRAP transporter solute-binding subunit n=1 Tax=Actinokineospora baliensis TaxID=547056 RepID=UPI00195E2D9E|nr:TAXI family TRAP transporter solute-binding subunit [Actinokineospora baliensis]MBM7773731.1 TRAP transporter TAXI family solute receptor [Actinokineospora baliensis]